MLAIGGISPVQVSVPAVSTAAHPVAIVEPVRPIAKIARVRATPKSAAASSSTRVQVALTKLTIGG